MLTLHNLVMSQELSIFANEIKKTVTTTHS